MAIHSFEAHKYLTVDPGEYKLIYVGLGFSKRSLSGKIMVWNCHLDGSTEVSDMY